MFSNPTVVILTTTFLIILSAFFVIVEFSLLGVRRYRLENEAVESKTARAALKGVNELTIMLAGAQLGITACTFALGAITKPAVDKWLAPLLESWGISENVAGTFSFLLSLLFVTFLHLVVGEMAPKSWAIAHPETSAKLIGIPSQMYIWLTKPILVRINNLANRLVAASGVTPVDRAAVGGQDVETIRHLVEHSASAGTIETTFKTQLSEVLHLETLTVKDLLNTNKKPTSVPANATVREVREAVKQSQHLRILLDNGTQTPHVVHIRDTLMKPLTSLARDVARAAFTLPAQMKVYDALTHMRQNSQQLAVVLEEGSFIGVITLSDIIHKVLPQPSTQ